ncbi:MULTISPECIES: hypothetical protein [unclassified Bosea (in: a-proteobacteria)]|uniref:hypothetical protein n=1 Tax=unclassified Bosea (in: a-proteobacteria) TaxID=2653178 RepID=UPI000F7F2631|nr:MULTISPECIES: hypothetical protein [unclassified Bosea (in: a-proteobacteria)]
MRFVTMACAILLSAAAATPADAQIRIDRDQTGRVVAISGLPTASGCVRGTGLGQVVDRKLEKGELHGFTFNEPPYGDGYINLPAAYDIKDRAAYARLRVALDDLLRKGARLKIRSVACGAAGRIVELVSATLVDDPPAPKAAPAVAPAPAPVPAPKPTPYDQPAATPSGDSGIKMDDGDDSLLRSPDSTPKPAAAAKIDEPPPPPPAAASEPRAAAEPPPSAPRKPSRWRLSQPTKAQIDLAIASNDRTFGFSLSCSRTPKGGLAFGNWFLPPRSWNIATSATPISIDGRPQRWEVGGADEGLMFSDAQVDGTASLSSDALGQLARGQRLTVNGRTDRGRLRDAVFDITSGEGSFAAFVERCQKLPRG